MARFSWLVIPIFFFTPLSMWGQNKELLYRSGTTGGVVNENALKPTWANIQNAPVFDYAAQRIWLGNGSAQTSSTLLTFDGTVLTSPRNRINMLPSTASSNNGLYFTNGSPTSLSLGVSTDHAWVQSFGGAALKINPLGNGIELLGVTTATTITAATITANNLTATNLTATDLTANNISSNDRLNCNISTAPNENANFGFGVVTGSQSIRIGTGVGYNWVQSFGGVPIKMNNLGNNVEIPSSNLSVGTTSPTNRLHVSAPANPLRLDGLATGANTDAMLTQTGGIVRSVNAATFIAANQAVPTLNAVMSAGNSTSVMADLAGGMIVGGGSSNSNATSALKLIGGYSSPVAGRLLLGDGSGWKMHIGRGTGASPTDLITIQDDGKMGVGTTSPSHTLDVVGDARITGKFRLGTGSNHSTIEKSGNSTIYNNVGDSHIFQSLGAEFARFDGATGGLKLNNAATLTFRNDASVGISSMTNGDVSYQPANSALYARNNGKRKDYRFGVNFRQNRQIFNDISCNSGYNETVSITDTTHTLFLTSNCPNQSVSNPTITLPSNPQNDVIVRIVSKDVFNTLAFQVASGTGQGIVTTPTSWSTTTAWSEWECRFYSTTEGSQGGEWTITKIR